jgi:formiminoglutamase
LKKAAAYPTPSYTDKRDRRMLQIIRAADGAGHGCVNILGIPFDGAVLGRRGAADGPSAIRRAMSGFSNYNVELGVDLKGASVLDIGDVVVSTEDVLKAHAEIESEVREALAGDSLLAILGGDNSVSLPSLTACSKKLGRMGLVVIDSHFDLRGEINGRPTSGSSYGLAIERLEGLDPRRTVEVGVHGFLNARPYYDKARRLGISIVTAKEVREKGARVVAEKAYATASKGADAVYVSVDLDAVDIDYVSGVSAPSVGGLTANELLELVFELARGEKVKCADLVELAPSLDQSERSERVASAALMSLIGGFVSRKTSREDGN